MAPVIFLLTRHKLLHFFASILARSRNWFFFEGHWAFLETTCNTEREKACVILRESNFTVRPFLGGGGGARNHAGTNQKKTQRPQTVPYCYSTTAPTQSTRATSKRPMGCRVSLVFQNFDTSFKKNRWSLLPRTPPLQIPTVYVLTEDALDWARQRLNECFFYTKRSFRAHRQK